MTDETPQAIEPAEAAMPETPVADSAPADEQATETPETQPEQKPKPKFEARFSEVYRNWRETERDRDYWREMATRVQVQPPKAPEPETPPTLEQHGYDEGKYQQAILEYARKTAAAEARAVTQAELKAAREAQVQQERVAAFQSREASFAEKVEDYHELVYSPTTPISETMAEVIGESEIGPELAYHLAKTPTVARAIYSLPATRAAIEMVRLEAKLTAAKSAPRPVTQAPPPPPKVSAVEPEVERDPDKMSMNDWLKMREKQIRKNQGR